METRPARRIPAIAVGALLATMLAACGGSDGAAGGTPSPSPAPVAAVGVSLTTASLGVGQTTQASATLRDASGAILDGRFVSWSSSSGSVATVSVTGLVTAVSTGTATITAASEGRSGWASLSVTVAPVASVAVRLVTNSLVVGGTTEAFATLRDANSNVLANRTITWSTSNPSAATVSSTGVVTATGVGAATLTATSEGVAGSADLAVAAPVVVPPVAGQPARMTAVSALDQTGPPGGRVVQPPAVLVADSTGTPLSGVSVSFAVTSGGGGVGGSAAVTGSDGVARATSWTLGGAGTQSVKATSAALAGASVDFAGLAREAAKSFDITLRLLTPMTDSQTRAFVHAKQRIEEIIVGDLPSFNVNVGASSTCGGVALAEMVDDILILAEVGAKDGAGGTLAEAGPCYLRPIGSAFPVVGHMLFDIADIAKLDTNGTLETVVLHEMLHVIGFGTLWDQLGLLAGGGGSDPYFTGPSARDLLATRNNGGFYTGTPVPVENTGGAGTRDAHWRESVFDHELMTGWIDTGTVPFSATTVGSLQDLGYVVAVARADPFDLAHPAALMASGLATVEPPIHLGGDVRVEPPIHLGEDGRPAATP
jgi:hypothetical protein